MFSCHFSSHCEVTVNFTFDTLELTCLQVGWLVLSFHVLLTFDIRTNDELLGASHIGLIDCLFKSPLEATLLGGALQLKGVYKIPETEWGYDPITCDFFIAGWTS